MERHQTRDPRNRNPGTVERDRLWLRSTRNHPGHSKDPESGSAAVEAVIIVPVLMVILVLVVQMALWAHAAQVARPAASEGDRVALSAAGRLCGRSEPGPDCAGGARVGCRVSRRRRPTHAW